jgi:hypothetical protein
MRSMLPETRNICASCLNMVAYDTSLDGLERAGGMDVCASGETVKEIVTRWPAFLRFAVQNDERVGFVVPPLEACGFVRALARAVMH